MIFDLVQDFAAALDAMPEGHQRRGRLALLDEALRRDVNFMARHPTTLFQCLWNTGWWHGNPEAAKHLARPTVAPDEGLPILLQRGRALVQPGVPLGTALRGVLRGHTQAVTSVSYSPDLTRLATGSEDATVRLWAADTGREITALHGHEDQVWCVCFSPDGRRLASASFDRTVRVWDALAGIELAVLTGHDDRLNWVCYSPDGSRLASGALEFDKTVRLWDTATGSKLAVLRGHEHRDWLAGRCGTLGPRRERHIDDQPTRAPRQPVAFDARDRPFAREIARLVDKID